MGDRKTTMLSKYYLIFLWVVSISLGPILMVVRRPYASPMENFVYGLMIGPLCLLTLFFVYQERKKQVANNFEGSIQKEKLNQLQQESRLLFVIIGFGFVLLAGFWGWNYFG
ncbi:MAG: hypothetical protein OEZ05_15605 [Nitrospirota bacterium]|nr:hypothetical protein [Nitrospirota bacterium]